MIGLRELNARFDEEDWRLRTPLLISAGAFAFIIIAIFMWTIASRKTSFERQQLNAEAANPHWLEINLDTADHHRTYKESEIIAFTAGYSSAVRELYKLEVDDSGSEVTFTDELHVSDGQSMSMHPFAIVCCGSRIISLNDEPYNVRTQLRLLLPPGNYEMYMTTRRVFPRDIQPVVYHPSEWTTASNMLNIRIVQDPGWQERSLAKIETNPGDSSNCAILATLDIPAATALKLEQLRNGIDCRPGPVFPTTTLFHPSEYAAAFKILHQMVQSPTHGVVQYDVNTITQLKIWLTHPELRNPPYERKDYEAYSALESSVTVEYEKELVREICAVLPAKIPEARQITQATIDGVTQNKLLGISPCQ